MNLERPLSCIMQEFGLTCLMVDEELKRHRLEPAVQHFIEACKYAGFGGPMLAVDLSHDARRSATMRRITQEILRWRQAHRLTSEMYDQYLKYQPFFHDKTILGYERLCLYHPTRPDANALVTTLRKRPHDVEAQLNSLPSDLVRVKVFGCLQHAVQLLIDQDAGSSADAKLVFSFLEKQVLALHNADRKVALPNSPSLAPPDISLQGLLSPHLSPT